ncbi:PREDICTED: early light-induced protein 1, chloroplastic isoform X2 [Tarenaya hassleriana]|uniref:early light-induced protein 1, chloroplastic isoform X1 n=1 Tax=Tarenaya hassleriana TaxID=28532 RepID=UPI00053C97E5|nr:PREDICTED: early light-induced protein 1, chloroplastic isoform X1 [Tarenaya hassleriana]XP_010525223.1 PREDICTED: early light-induced protein 1, chloroplastic isoform X2 [Tarenaya hassleriana]
MATASFGMQSVFTGPATGSVTQGMKSNRFCLAGTVPGFKRNASMVVRCMAEGEPTREDSAPSSSPAGATPPEIKSKPSPPPKPKVSTKFSDVLAFSGPAPERINGRLAMVGFVAALAVELSKGENVLAQLSDGGVGWFVGTSALLTVASLVPLFKGVSAESKSGGLMTSDAELWNGRLAMLGLIALAFTEYVKGGTLV